MINLLLSLSLGFSAHAEVVEKTLAIVNSEVILESDLQELKHRLATPGLVDDALLDDKTVESLKKDKKVQLEYLVNEKLIESEIKRLNLTITNDRVENELKDMAKRNNVTVPEMTNILKEQGIAINDYKVFMKAKIEKQSLFDTEIISKLRISDEDAMNEYLKGNANSKPSIDEFSVSHIFFNPKKGGAEAALERANVVLGKLRVGGNFETLAEQFSEDPNFSTGGSLGTFKSGEFIPEIENAIANLKVGETTAVVKSRLGFHIVKLTAKKLTQDPKFAKAKDKIKEQLLMSSFKRQLKIWLENKKEESFIRIND